MPIQAEIDGIGILEFPDGTPNDVIQSAVKRTISERASAKPSIPQVAPKPETLETIGSPQALNQAVIKSGQVGQQQRFESQDPLVQQADFYLGKDSARKFQKFVAGNYEPLPDEDFTDKEREIIEKVHAGHPDPFRP